MRIIRREYEVYPFNELSDEAKQKAIERYGNINVDYSWWEMDCIYQEMAKDYGLEINMGEVCFDLDRDNYLYFETYNHGGKDNWITGIYIADYKKFCKKAGVRYTKKIKEDNFSINHKHYGGGSGKNYIDSYDLDEKTEEKLQACLDEFIDKVLSGLKEEYNHLTSEEAIIDTIESNEFEFLESGERFF
jgi:hypothetical protein